jgi:hypothetical protein
MVSTLGKLKDEGWMGALAYVFFDPPEVLLNLLFPVA